MQQYNFHAVQLALLRYTISILLFLHQCFFNKAMELNMFFWQPIVDAVLQTVFPFICKH